nr:transient receptor potential cation channel subfamily V member 1-like isoform X1 [Paramormyrops kingsleyae]
MITKSAVLREKSPRVSQGGGGMDQTNILEMKPFSLETDDRSAEERSQCKVKTKGWPFKGGRVEKIPMDTGYLEEVVTPKIRFNLNFDRKIRGCEEIRDQENAQRFGINSLFAAVSSRDISKLRGLHEYLQHTMKHLTNSEYESHGKNALIKGLLNLKNGKNDTIEFLLDIAEKMGDLNEFVNAAYTDTYYKGQTALHVAIERRSEFFTKLLVQKGADVHAKACGKFFQAHDGPNFYFGELPLSLAACTNQPAIVDFLIDNPYQKVDIMKTDSQGNTVLHALVLVADKENTEFIVRMYDHILTISAMLHPETKLEDTENHQKLTPLKLVAKTGKIKLFQHMIRRRFDDKHSVHLSRKFVEWAYGPVQSSLYDLTSLDSFEANSVLDIIVYGSLIPNRLEMLQLEPLCRLLNDKWEKFARWLFLFKFLIYLVYLGVFTTVAYNTRMKLQSSFSKENTDMDYVYLTGQVTCCIGALYFFFKGLSELKRKRPNLQTLLVDGYSEILFFVQAILFIISAVLYCCKRQEYLGFLVICLALSWINLLYFSRGSRHIGIYTVIMQKMILSDVLRFLFVYIVYLFGFSAAVVTLLDEPPPPKPRRNSTSRSLFTSINGSADCKKPTFKSLSFTTLELFKFTIGMGDLEFTENYKYKEVFYVLLISYIVFTYILLLNMLIALMNRTVEKLSEESLNIWKLQRAITILDLERTLPSCLRKRLRSGMEKDLGRKPETDKRWCFSVEEINWNKWDSDLGIINEEPGSCQKIMHFPPNKDMQLN